MTTDNMPGAGTRIRLLEMPETTDPDPIEPGTMGTVLRVEYHQGRHPWHQLWVDWDNSRKLALCVPPDRFEVLSSQAIDNPEPVASDKAVEGEP